MEWKVIVEKAVSQTIGGFGLQRDVLLRLLVGIHTEIARRYQQLRTTRDEEDRDCFRVFIRFAAHDYWHLFYLRVNDTRAANHLFVETINYTTRPVP
jgi:hypothetical protein